MGNWDDPQPGVKTCPLKDCYTEVPHGHGTGEVNYVAVPQKADPVNHPAHYGGADDPYEAIKVIEAWDLPWHLGDCVKYISRHGKKDPLKMVEDLKKARFYLDRYITYLESK